MRKASLLALPLVALVLAGCPADPTSSEEDACNGYYDAVSSLASSCGLSMDGFGDRSRFLTSCQKSVAAPGSGVTPAFLNTCSASLKGKCDVETTECKTPAGTLDDGAACVSHAQCKSKGCARASDALCGKCVPLKALGAECDPATDRCAEGSSCVNQGSTTGKGTCKTNPPKLKEGDACGDASSGSGYCDEGLTCDYAGTKKCVKEGDVGADCGTGKPSCKSKLVCTGGKCAEPPGEGGACDPASSEGVLCKTGLACDGDAKKCVKIVYAKPGEACDYQKTRCAKGSCLGVGFSNGKITPGKCPTILADGATCDPKSKDAACDDFASCKDGKCQIPDGASCK